MPAIGLNESTFSAATTATSLATATLMSDDDDIADAEEEPIGSEPRTPPTTTVHMRMEMCDHAKTLVGANESSLHVSLAFEGGDEGEDFMRDIFLSPCAAAEVTKAEGELSQSKIDTFESNVTWKEAVLAEVLTYELHDMCLKGNARLEKLHEQEQVEEDRQRRFLRRRLI